MAAKAGGDFGAALAERGLRLTQQRMLVLKTAAAREGHFDADELWRLVRRSDRSASRATVYRTLSLLVESGFLRKVEMDDRAYFEHARGHRHHDHLVCVNCGRIMEFAEPEIERLQEAVCARSNFQPLSHRLQIQGLCGKCARAKKI